MKRITVSNCPGLFFIFSFIIAAFGYSPLSQLQAKDQVANSLKNGDFTVGMRAGRQHSGQERKSMKASYNQSYSALKEVRDSCYYLRDSCHSLRDSYIYFNPYYLSLLHSLHEFDHSYFYLRHSYYYPHRSYLSLHHSYLSLHRSYFSWYNSYRSVYPARHVSSYETGLGKLVLLPFLNKQTPLYAGKTEAHFTL